MASDFEDQELENLRQAALNSIKKKVKSQPPAVNNVQNQHFNYPNNQQSSNSRYQTRNHQNPKKSLYAKQFIQQPHHHNHQMDTTPQFFNGHLQFNKMPNFYPNNAHYNEDQFQPNHFHQQPRSNNNLIVLTAENESNQAKNQIPNQYRNKFVNKNSYHKNNAGGYNSFKKSYPKSNEINKPEMLLKELKTDLSVNTDSMPSRFNRKRDYDSSDDDDRSDKFELGQETFFNNDEAVLNYNSDDDKQPIDDKKDSHLSDDQPIDDNIEDILSLKEDDLYQIELMNKLENESKDESTQINNSSNQKNCKDPTAKMVLRNSLNNESDDSSKRLSQVNTKLTNKDQPESSLKSQRLTVVKTKQPIQNISTSSYKRNNESPIKSLPSLIKDDISPARSDSALSNTSSESSQTVKKQRKLIEFNKDDYAEDKQNHSKSQNFKNSSRQTIFRQSPYNKRYDRIRLKDQQTNSTKLKSRINVSNKDHIMSLTSSTKDQNDKSSKKIQSLIVKN